MDKNDIYWCLSTEGLSSLVSSHPGIVFSPIENGLAKFIVGKIVGLAKKGECIECIEFISENKINKKELEITLFDLLMKEYVWHMGEVCYEQSRNLMQGIRGMYALFNAYFRNNLDSLDSWSKKYDKAFINVYKKLNNFSYVVLTNLLDSYNVIKEGDYSTLSNKYILNSHVKFENLIAPVGHVYEGQRFIDIIIDKDRSETTRYYKERYKDLIYLKGGFKGDYPNYFYNKMPDTIIGNEDIYL